MEVSLRTQWILIAGFWPGLQIAFDLMARQFTGSTFHMTSYLGLFVFSFLGQLWAAQEAEPSSMQPKILFGIIGASLFGFLYLPGCLDQAPAFSGIKHYLSSAALMIR
jgi:hypothetical protein